RSRSIKTADRGKAHVPFLVVPHMAPSRRLELAKALANELKERQGRNLVAVGVYGSVARGEERAHSDVDVLVIVRRPRAAIHHFVRDGVILPILLQSHVTARTSFWCSGTD